jgi:HD superfamily phosphohydrolase YqeK
MHDYTKVVPFRRRRRAARCSNPMTEELASKAKTMVIRLGMAQHVAAARLGVNQARISEVIHGHRFKDAPFASLDLID